MKTVVIYGSERHGSTYHRMEGEEKCPFYSEKQPIITAMEEADILVFSSPTYCMAPTGATMDFLEKSRISFEKG